MPVDVNGNITRPPSPIPVSGQDADAPQVNVPIGDIYTALNMLAFLDGRKPLRGNTQMNGYRATGAADAVDNQDYVTLGQLQAFLGQLSQIPTGFIGPLTGMAIPAGWVRANGQYLFRATYPNLWSFAQSSGNLAASDGTKTLGQYGPGDGSTTFTVPNLEADGGYFIRPVSSGRGIGSVQQDEFKSHNHAASVNDPGHDHAYTSPAPAQFTGIQFTGYISASAARTSWEKTGITVSVSNSGGTETRPQNIAYPVIIKA